MTALIVVDVDGVLNPWFRCHPPYCRCHPSWVRRKVYPSGVEYRVVLNPAHGPQLLQLAQDTGAALIWGTTWCDDANKWIGPLIGLPELPVIDIPACPQGTSSGAWKAAQVARVVAADGQPFVWLEDEPDAGRAAAALVKTPHLVIPVEERTGLLDEHLDTARDWLLNHGPSS